jgi:hypothetical protein
VIDAEQTITDRLVRHWIINGQVREADDCNWKTIKGRPVCITTGHVHAEGEGLPRIGDGPGAFLVRHELLEANLPPLHYDGLVEIQFGDPGQWIKAGVGGQVVDAAGRYSPATHVIQLAMNAPRGGNIQVFGGHTVLHEIGHHVHISKLTNEAADEWQTISGNGQNARISAYAQTNRGEHFAEAYRAYAAGGGKRRALKNLEPTSYAFMQRLMRPNSPQLLPAGQFPTGDWLKRYRDNPTRDFLAELFPR